MRGKKLIYIVIVFLICLVPSAGLFFIGSGDSSENRTLSDFPELREESGEWNRDWLSDAGAYFQEHFALRSELVTANAVLKSRIFGVSADDGVIDGTDGWLYYMDSLDDYLGREPLSKRELFNIAHSLALMQEYAAQKGISFLFVPVPNKNTLYGGHMPYYYQYRVNEESNLSGLLPVLEAEGVNYVDLQQVFQDTQEVLYHRTDSHWTNRGAALAYEQILSGLDKEGNSYLENPCEVRKDFRGDLAVMLYPAAVEPEEEFYFQPEHSFIYENEVENNFAPKITTKKEGASGSLVMYRDSFGNALLPFMADAYGSGYFSRGEPFLFSDLDTHLADTLVIERVERFLPNLAKNAAVMEAPRRDTVPEGAVLADTYSISADGVVSRQEEDGAETQYLSCTQNGVYRQLEGVLDFEELPADTRIYVRVNQRDVYEAFPVTVEQESVRNAYGYRLFLGEEEDLGVEVFLVPAG